MPHGFFTYYTAFQSHQTSALFLPIPTPKIKLIPSPMSSSSLPISLDIPSSSKFRKKTPLQGSSGRRAREGRGPREGRGRIGGRKEAVVTAQMGVCLGKWGC